MVYVYWSKYASGYNNTVRKVTEYSQIPPFNKLRKRKNEKDPVEKSVKNIITVGVRLH